jgi:hypothetical protein
MDSLSENPFSKSVTSVLEDIPPLPSHLYRVIIGKINRRRMITRVVFGLAGSLLIAVSSFTVTQVARSPAPYSKAAAEELSCINAYINSDVYKANAETYDYYEEVLYQDQ